MITPEILSSSTKIFSNTFFVAAVRSRMQIFLRMQLFSSLFCPMELNDDYCPECQLDTVAEEKSDEPTVPVSDILNGTATIPISQVFGFVTEHIAKAIGEHLGAVSDCDRTFTYFEQLKSRKRLEEITQYTFLHPLLGKSKENSAPVLSAIEPYTQCKNERGVLVDKPCFSMYEFEPESEGASGGLLALHQFFEKEMRRKSIGASNLSFAHIIASFLECHTNGYLSFSVYEAIEDEPQPRWVFQVNNADIYIYKLVSNPPYEAIEKSFKSQWISSTKVYFKRSIKPAAHFSLSDSEIEEIKADPDVAKIKATE